MKKTFSNFRTLAALLMAGAAFAACSNDDNNIIEEQPVVNPGEQVYTLTINAVNGDGTTRALDLDDAGKLTASWANGDELTVRNFTKSALLGGTLTASNASGNTATFSGALTGEIATGNKLMLYYHRIASLSDLANQDGTLKGTNGAEKFDAAMAEVTVKSVDDDGAGNQTITIEEASANFDTQTAMVKLTLQDNAATPNKLNATSLNIKSKLTVETTTITEDLITFLPTADTYTTNGEGGGVLYFALPSKEDLAAFLVAKYSAAPYSLPINQNTVLTLLASAPITFTATVGSNTYSVTKTGYKFAAGKYYAATLTMAPTGALVGRFSVSSNKQVYFSQGNLQAVIASGPTNEYNYTASSWKFAENQWDYIGNAAGNTTFAVGSTVDLFGWVGTTASYDTYGLCTQTSTNNVYYGTSTGDALKNDWGNTIGTGWRTLTGGDDGEWSYLLYTRITGGTVFGTASARYAHAEINTDVSSVYGLILFPDGVDIAASEVTTAGTVNGTSDWGTKCTSAQWTALAAKGCVFLPAAGYREGTTVYSDQNYYWSSSPSTSSSYSDQAREVDFKSFSISYSNLTYRYRGCSVRLVRDVE